MVTMTMMTMMTMIMTMMAQLCNPNCQRLEQFLIFGAMWSYGQMYQTIIIILLIITIIIIIDLSLQNMMQI